MTAAQREALKVLCRFAPLPVVGWKYRTRSDPVPRVNRVAAESLVSLGFARARSSKLAAAVYYPTAAGVLLAQRSVSTLEPMWS